MLDRASLAVPTKSGLAKAGQPNSSNPSYNQLARISTHLTFPLAAPAGTFVSVNGKRTKTPNQMRTIHLSLITLLALCALLSALLPMAVFPEKNLSGYYRHVIEEVCEQRADLRSEAEVLDTYPQLAEARALVDRAIQMQCRLSQLAGGPAPVIGYDTAREIRHCQQELRLLRTRALTILRAFDQDNPSPVQAQLP